MSTQPTQFVSRAGEKLQYALDTFHMSVQGKICADLGCNRGGFTDCLLQNGASHVYAVDTARGILEWKLRNDVRVTVLEKTNALHVTFPAPVNFITIDVGWTRQVKILPHAISLLAEHGDIISLIKPHYEARKEWLTQGKLETQFLKKALHQIQTELTEHDIFVRNIIQSPITGTKGHNIEYLAWITK